MELISLYPNATHVLQPLDVAFFYPLKNAWKEEIEEFKRTIGFQPFQKEDFAPILKKAVDKLNVREIMKNSLATCGLALFAINNFNYTILENEFNTANETNVCQSRDISSGEHRKNLENLENVMGESLRMEFEHSNIAVENE